MDHMMCVCDELYFVMWMYALNNFLTKEMLELSNISVDHLALLSTEGPLLNKL